MITKTKRLFLGFILLTILTSCGPTLTPFTQNVYNSRNWTENELKRVQFYLSRDIILRRQLSGGSFEVISGEIKIVNGKKVEEIRIPGNTPGILLFRPKDDHFAISFEEGGDQRYLVFGPNPKAGGRFVLLASEWKRRVGTVTYEGKKYRVDDQSAYASLLVDLKKVNKTELNRRTAGGRKVSL